MQIQAALDGARAVIVVWTPGATTSDWVYSEAVAAGGNGHLVNVRAADVPFGQIPKPFDIHHIVDASDTERLLRDVARVMSGKPLATRVPLHEIYRRQYGQAIVDAKHRELPTDPFGIAPSDLLQARHGVVSYVDAAGQRQALLHWATAHPRRAAARLLHGPGGLGKTRLLIEVAAQLRKEHGWHAGFVERIPPQATEAQRQQWWQALDQLVAHPDPHGDLPGLLLVIDYAEGRQSEVVRIAEAIEARDASAATPIRLVLLTRSAGEWWDRLRDEHGSLQRLFDPRRMAEAPPVVELAPVDAAAQRLALFDASRSAFAAVLQSQGAQLPEGGPSAALRQRIATGDRNQRPLTIQMAALAWLSGATDTATQGSAADLLRQMLALERGHWAKLLGGLDDDTRTALERALAQLTLLQGAPDWPSARRLLELDAHYAGHRRAPADTDPLLRQLGRIAASPTGGLRPVEPDLLGEHLVASVADPHLLEACVSASSAGQDSPQLQQNLLTVLQRASQLEHGPVAQARTDALLAHLASHHLTVLAQAMVAVAVDTPGHLIDQLRQTVQSQDKDALAVLDAKLPEQSLALMDLALDVTLRRETLARAALHVEPETDYDFAQLGHFAARRGTTGNRLSALGQREPALAATEEAVQIRRALAASRPDAFLPDLAMSLGARSMVLIGLDRPGDAARDAKEGIEQLWPLIQAQPDAARELAVQLAQTYLRHCEAAQTAADETLLARLVEALELGDEAQEEG